jgi:hypothetical protein
MMNVLPSASKMLSGPGVRVIRLVYAHKTPCPPRTLMLMRSPEWKGWFSSGEGLPLGPGSKCPPAAAQRSHSAVS